MSGIMEILLIVVIILVIFMGPRLLARRPEYRFPASQRSSTVSGPIRFAILLSLLWPALIAFFVEPWNGGWPLFLYLAAGPVALIWGIWWVISGFRKEKG